MRQVLYAILPEPAVDGDGPDLTGIGQAPVRYVRAGGLAAVVSDLPKGRLRPKRRNLQAHHTVLTAVLQQHGTPLPFAFGTVVPDGDALHTLLADHEPDLLRQLTRVAGRVEHGVKVRWDVEDVFRYIVQRSPELAARRDALFGNGRTPEQDELINLGRAFEGVRNQAREAMKARIREVFGPATVELRFEDPKGEPDLVDVACLVPADGAEAFQQAVHTLAEQLDDDHAIDISGPWVPFSFVDLVLG